MGRELLFLTVACLNIIMGPQVTAADIASAVSKLLECCPSMPVLVNQASVNACMVAIEEKKSGFHMFGGSVEKTRRCVLECAFKIENLITTMDNGSLTVNLTAVDVKLGANATSKWQNVISGVKANCTATAPIPFKKSVSQKCTSGAYELSTCLYKYMITLCPERIETTDCVKRLTAFPLTFVQKLKKVLKKKTTTAAPEATTTAANDTDTTPGGATNSSTVATPVDANQTTVTTTTTTTTTTNTTTTQAQKH